MAAMEINADRVDLDRMALPSRVRLESTDDCHFNPADELGMSLE